MRPDDVTGHGSEDPHPEGNMTMSTTLIRVRWCDVRTRWRSCVSSRDSLGAPAARWGFYILPVGCSDWIRPARRGRRTPPLSLCSARWQNLVKVVSTGRCWMIYLWVKVATAMSNGISTGPEPPDTSPWKQERLSVTLLVKPSSIRARFTFSWMNRTEEMLVWL